MNELIEHLSEHIIRPQKSERWSMYRLIVPVVDFANSTMKLRDYFEFNQTSRHGTSQSVDIVLLNPDGNPALMVEAKRVDRSISAEYIEKYLEDGVRGIVTNGFHWILCRDGRNKLISLCTDSGREINPEALEEIVSFMRDDQVPTPEWGTAEVEYVPSFVRPERIVKALKAQRKSSSMTVCSDLNELHRQVASLEDASALDTVFLNAVANEFGSKSGALPPHIRCEVRQTRVSFFYSRVSTGSQRVARIELGKNQPDILLLTDLAVTEPLLEQLARPVPHDKGPHMRRYRLSEESQTLRFGHALADVLSR